MTFAALALISYAGVIDFSNTPLTYMLYIIYFRSPNRHPTIDWSVFDINSALIPAISSQTGAVLRTFIFAIIYLVLNFLLFISLFRIIGESSDLNPFIKSKIFLFYFRWNTPKIKK